MAQTFTYHSIETIINKHLGNNGIKADILHCIVCDEKYLVESPTPLENQWEFIYSTRAPSGVHYVCDECIRPFLKYKK